MSSIWNKKEYGSQFKLAFQSWRSLLHCVSLTHYWDPEACCRWGKEKCPRDNNFTCVDEAAVRDRKLDYAFSDFWFSS